MKKQRGNMKRTASESKETDSLERRLKKLSRIVSEPNEIRYLRRQAGVLGMKPDDLLTNVIAHGFGISNVTGNLYTRLQNTFTFSKFRLRTATLDSEWERIVKLSGMFKMRPEDFCRACLILNVDPGAALRLWVDGDAQAICEMQNPRP